jgi:hypothetical protein
MMLAALLAAPKAPSGGEAVERFLVPQAAPLTSAIAFRHLEAMTGGGAMRGWIDACTVLDGADMRYWVIDEGGSDRCASAP